MGLDGKRIVITGGARGIGAEAAAEMRSRGAIVVTLDVSDGAERHEIHVDEALRVKALLPLDRMLNFAAELKLKTQGNA